MEESFKIIAIIKNFPNPGDKNNMEGAFEIIMAEIINFFPSIDPVAESISIEANIEKHLRKLGLSKEMKDEMIDGVKHFLASTNFSFKVNDGNGPTFSTEQVMFLADKIHEYHFLIIAQLLRVQLELYNLRHGYTSETE